MTGKRRVVVTGMGIASPLGLGVANVWRRLLAGESGIGPIRAFDVSDLPAKIAGEIPLGTKAVEDSGWTPAAEEDRCATGVMIGSGIGGLETIYDAARLVLEGKTRRLSPFFIPSALINLASGHVSIKYGFK